VERTQTVTGSAAAGEFHRQQIAEHRQRRAADERFPFNAGRLTAKALSRLGVRHLFTLSGGHLFPLYDSSMCRVLGRAASSHGTDPHPPWARPVPRLTHRRLLRRGRRRCTDMNVLPRYRLSGRGRVGGESIAHHIKAPMLTTIRISASSAITAGVRRRSAPLHQLVARPAARHSAALAGRRFDGHSAGGVASQALGALRQ
jgi:hypothetical protein